MDEEQFSNINYQVIHDDAAAGGGGGGGGGDERHTPGWESPPPTPPPLKKQKADDEGRDETEEKADDEGRYESAEEEEDDDDDDEDMHASESNSSDELDECFIFVDEQGNERKHRFRVIEDEGDPSVWIKYLREIKESEGFDFYHYPGLYEAAQFHPQGVVGIQEFIDLSKAAIEVYNRDNGKSYELEEVEKANSQLWGCGTNFYITFRAKNSNADASDTFQAKVWSGIGSLPQTTVEFCRLK